MRLFVVSVMSLLVGCAANNKVWYKADGTQDMFSQDRYSCLQQAQQPTSTAYFGNYGGLLPTRQLTASSGMVTNDPLLIACMNAKGWYLTDPNLTPMRDGGVAPSTAPVKSKLSVLVGQMRELCGNPTFAAYHAKTYCSVSDATLLNMTDKSKISNQEKDSLNMYSQAYDRLYKEWNDLARIEGNAQAKQLASYNEIVVQPAVQKNRLDLFEGKISWGDYNRRRKEILDASSIEFNRINQKR